MRVGSEAEPLVGLHRVGAGVLERVRPDLVEEADAAAFLIEIDDYAPPLPRDQLHGALELRPAVAALGPEHVARETFRVHPHQDARLAGHVALHQCHVLGLVDVIPVGDHREVAQLRREPGFSHPVHESLGLEPVGHELGDRDEREPVLRGEGLQLGTACHGAVGVEDLADDPGGHESGEPRQIDARFGLPHALEHAARPARSGKMWPGRRRSPGTVAGLMATWIVVARSLAEMPVVTPNRRSASMLTVNAVA